MICTPGNYPGAPASRIVRFSVLANHGKWLELLGTHDSTRAEPARRARYEEAKRQVVAAVLESAASLGLDARGRTTILDMFTPLTLERYTRHAQGQLYGSPEKRRRGQTHCGNLFLIGADQGYLGIVGSMLSGITIANLHGLR